MTYTFVIPGPPTPWTVWPRRGPLPPAFERMQAYQHVIQLYLRREWGDQPPLSDAVTLVIDFHIPLPRLETGEKYRFPIRRGHDPDVTNLVKACEDALQGIVLVNDAQVVSARGRNAGVRQTTPLLRILGRR